MWGEWQVLADRYSLDIRHTWAALADTVAVFLAAGVSTPVNWPF